MAVGQRIAEERASLGMTQQELADLITRAGYPISQTGIDKIEKRDAKRPKCLREAAIALRLNEDWLRTGRGVKERDDGAVRSMHSVSLVSWVSAGALTGNIASDDILGTVETETLPPGDWIALKVTGDSMDLISPPDSVIFVNRRDKQLVPNGLYVIDDGEGSTTYKRYRPGPPPRFEPVSTRKGIDPIFFDNEPTVVGRVRRSVLEM